MSTSSSEGLPGSPSESHAGSHDESHDGSHDEWGSGSGSGSGSVWDFVNPLDAKALARQFREAAPIRFFHIDGFLRPEFARAVRDAYPAYEEASHLGREFRAVNEQLKVQICDADRFPEPVRQLARVLAAPELVETLTEITEIPGLLADDTLAGGGMHLMGSGGRLDVHVDFNYLEERGLHRRLNILVFLNDPWEESWGGNLELWDPEVRRCLRSFTPELNRCVVFNTTESSFHGVTPLRCPAGRTRNSFAAYYYTEQPPEGWDGTKHSTVFRARPSEWLRGHVLMPVEDIVRGNRVLRRVDRLLRRRR